MNKLFKWSVCLVIGVVFISGCATTTQMVKPDIQNSSTIQASYDKVWGALMATLAEKAYPIESVEKESGLITTKFVNFASGYGANKEIKRVSQRPSVFMGTWNQGRYTLSIFVNSKDNIATDIKITAHIEAYENNMTNSWHICQTKGVVESDILQAVSSKLE